MGLKDEVSSIFLERKIVVTRPSQVYATALSPIDIFNIVGGAVEIVDLGAIVTAAAVGAPTLAVTINGVAADDASAPAVAGAVGTVIWIPLDAAGLIINAAAIPKIVTTILDDTGCTPIIAGIQPAAVGVIQTIWVVATSVTLQWWVVYRRLSPASNIVVA